VTDRLSKLLAERGILIADGATGTNYFDMGLASGEPPESWLLDAPEKVADLHRRFVEAGSDIILTNSFGATRFRLKLHNLQDRATELNRLAAEIARRIADESGREIVVAGSMGPTGELFEPLGALTMDSAVAAFTEQARGLAEGGADVAWIETMSAAEELEAAARGAIAAGLPYVFTASFDTAGRTMMGLTPESLAGIAALLPVAPLAYGANCGIGPGDLVASILAMSAAAPDDVLVAKGNCGIPTLVGDKVHYGGTPELMAEYVRLAQASGARIIGGCCGTSPSHILAMRHAVDAGGPRVRPTIEAVEASLGPISRPKGSEGRSRTGRRGRSGE
jgi:5-methyltetrahydrofolate--homocysteine methyltransferase